MIRNVLKILLPACVRRQLRRLQKSARYRYRRIAIARAIRRGNLADRRWDKSMKSCIALATMAFGNTAGGIERNLVYLANDLVRRGYPVLLLSFDRADAAAFYDFDPRVRWVRLGRMLHANDPVGFWGRLALIRRIRRTLTEHGVRTLVCFHHGILFRFMAACLLRRTRIVCSERSSLTMYDYIRARKWNLNFILMLFVDAITVQFPSYVEQYPRFVRHKIHVIHNPVFPSPIVDDGARQPMILSIGRHAAQKRFSLLVEAFSLVADTFPQWRATIVGDGPYKPALERQIERLHLSDRIELVPATHDLDGYYRRATIYCQPSQWEGFPNAQAEAMAAGVIPVGLAATAGVADLIEDGVNGTLAPRDETAEALAEALRRVMAAPQSWARMSAQARRVSEVYAPASWQRCWNRLLVDKNA